MTKPKLPTVTSEIWRVRVCLPSALLHMTSLIEPVMHMRDGRVVGVDMKLLTDGPDSGDTIGFIDWAVVTAVTWRVMKQGGGT